ncbi:MAG: InlB B-repeat-containing protein [Candidatus Wenzhouxiangella sp. M2_3B_020]
MNRITTMFALAALASAAHAATIPVNTTADAVADDGFCTLREAIVAANTNVASGASAGECPNGVSGTDFITFPPYVVPATINIGGTPLPEITEPLVMTGPGRTTLTIRGDGTDEILTSASDLIVSGLTLREAGGSGKAAIRMSTPADLSLSDCGIRDSTTQNGGGAISFRGDTGGTRLTIDNCRFFNNQMTNAVGGTLVVSATSGPAIVDITATEFVDNSGGNGPAIFLSVPSNFDPGEIIGLSVVDTTFSGNVSAGDGGAIHSASSNHAIRIRRSTFENNDAARSGGAAFLSGPDVQITNSTFHGNAAGDDAGALWLVNAPPNTATIASSTITQNTANGNDSGSRGGGIAGQAQDVLLRNTVIAENDAPGGSGPDCADQPVSDGYNLIGAVNDCSFGAITGDQTGNLASPLSPVLGNVANNGGPTRTRLPQSGSPLLDAADPSGCLRADGVALATDQRGLAREADGDADGTARCDIGAAEAAKPPTFTLGVQVSGSGNVTSSPAGIACPGDCSESYAQGTVVELSATADPGFAFDGWSGDCAGTGSCQVTMDQARSVQATFSQNQDVLTIQVSGSGSVTSSPAGINCPGDCSESYAQGTVIDLTAAADPGFTFDGWSGDCAGTGSCQVTMDQARSVTATFTQIVHPLTVQVSGSGSVASSPAGINCPGDCSEDYGEGTAVTLTATPDAGFAFDGWTGDCTGTGSCQVTMDQARSVQATFSQEPFSLTVQVFGNGQVTSSPAGISCPGTCSADFAPGTVVDLQPLADPANQFVGWGGDCSGNGSCQVIMDSARSIDAAFTNDGIVVNSMADVLADDGECTLREAIIAANGNATSGTSTGECAAGAPEPTVDRILFNAGISGSINLSSSLGSISEAVEISGPGASTLAIDGSGIGNSQRILSVLDDTIIEGLTFRNASSGDSGALRVAAPTTIRDCAFEDNAAADGGAIRSVSDLTVERCRFTRNIATDFGGGAIRTGSADRLTTIRDSLFESNESQGGFAPGGAIRVDGTGHVTEISRSTFTGNSVSGGGDGGAISVGGDGLTIVNSSFSGNNADRSGGAIEAQALDNVLHNVTLTGNRADADGDGVGNGGGVDQPNAARPVTLRNSIAAGNIDAGGEAPDCSGAFTTGGFNVIGAAGGSCTGFTDAILGDLVGTPANPLDAGLAPLADNGGPTPTHALEPGSPAIEGGDPAGCDGATGASLSFDQRGRPRPTPSDTPCDIGAYEDFGDVLFLDQFETLPLAR